MKVRLCLLVAVLVVSVGGIAPLTGIGAASALPVGPQSVDLLLPTPCLYDLRSLPAVDVPGQPPRQTPSLNPYQPADLKAPALPKGPYVASTAPMAWADGGAGDVVVQSQPGLSMDAWATADTQVAVDDRFVVQAVNSRLRISDRTGERPAVTYDLATFFAGGPGCIARDSERYALPYHPDMTFAAQPTLFRDPRTARWFVSASVYTVSAGGSVSGRVRLAVSQTDDPTGGYAVYPVTPPAVDPGFQNHPRFAITDDKVVFAWDQYVRNQFVGSETVALPKLPLLQGSPGLGTDFPPDPGRRMMAPAQQLSGGTAAYVAGLGTNGTLVFDVIDGAADDAIRTTHSVTVTPWTAPPMAQQKDGPLVVTDGGVLQSPVYRDGTWWASMTEGCAAEGATSRFACVRMWELSVDGSGVPTLGQEFDIAEPGADLLNPASVLDADGNLVVALTRTSLKSVPGMIVVGRAKSSPRNTISRPVYSLNGGSPFQFPTTWGTYAGAAVAPSGNVWLAQQTAEYGWATQLVELRPAPFTAWPTPGRHTIEPGGTATSSVTVSSLRGWSGPVSLSLSGAPAGSTASLSTTRLTVPSGGSATATVTVTTATTLQSDFAATVKACGGGACQSVDITVQLRQFTLSTTNAVPRLDRGGPGTVATVKVSSVHGYSGTVALSVSGGSATTTATLDRSSVVVAPGSPATVQVTLRVGIDEPADRVSFTVNACDGYCRTVPITVFVKNFSLYPTPFSLTLSPGQTGTGTVTVYSTNSWQGTVSLSISGAPVGSSASIGSSVSLGVDEAKQVPLTVSMGPNQTTGFVLTIQGCATFCRTTYVAVDPPSPAVALTADPAELWMTQHSAERSTITIASVGGFSGTVRLTTSGGPTLGGVTINQDAVTVAPDSPATAILTIGVGAQAGDFAVTVTAWSPDGTWNGSTNVTVHMT